MFGKKRKNAKSKKTATQFNINLSPEDELFMEEIRKAAQAKLDNFEGLENVTVRTEELEMTRLSKPARHMSLLKELNDIYTRKNHDYGDSFHETFLEERFAMARIRLSDKLNRFKKLSRNAAEYGLVEDESIRDTLMDLANYAIMTVLEIDDEKAGIK